MLRTLFLSGSILGFGLSLGGCWAKANDGAQPSSTAPVSSSSSDADRSESHSSPRGKCSARSPGRLTSAEAPGGESSSVVLARLGDQLIALVADEEQSAIHAVDARTLQELAVTPLPGKPKHLRLLEDGRVAVGLRDQAKVQLWEAAASATAPLELRCEASVAVEPWGIAEAGDKLLVTSGFGATFTVLRSGDLEKVRELPLPREPRVIVLNPSGDTAFVSHAVGGVVSAIDLADASSKAVRIDVRAGARTRDDESLFGGEKSTKPIIPREGTQGYSLVGFTSQSKDPKRRALEGWRLIVPHTSVDPGMAGSGVVSTGYGVANGPRPVVPFAPVIDPKTKKVITDDVFNANGSPFNQDCLLPRSAVVRGTTLFVACMDIDAVVLFDASFSDATTREIWRYPVPAGPSALALDQASGDVFVWSELDRSLSKLSGGEKMTLTRMVPWKKSAETVDAKVLRGRYLFHTSRDIRIAPSRACASCHPEGRDDGLVWSSPDGQRQTPMLAGRIEGTAPYGWFGENARLVDHVQNTFERLGGKGMKGRASKEDLEALLAYVSTLPPPPASPASDPSKVGRGKDVFIAFGCAGCHVDGGSDSKRHDVGSGIATERRRDFDTPSLLRVRGSAPYFHDGRYQTLEELLQAKDNQMIDPSKMTDPDRAALLAYLETL